MTDTLTAKHLDWTQSFTGIDIGAGDQAADAADPVPDPPASTGAEAGAEPGGGQGAQPGGAPGGILDSIGDVIGGAAHAVEGAVTGAFAAIGNFFTGGHAQPVTPPPPPPPKAPPPAVGPMQEKRAKGLRDKLSTDDQKKYDELLSGAKSDKERAYLTKGLASGHSVSELQAFEAKIAGKDEKWMQDNLSLTGDSNGKGVKQQWMMSCNATAVEAVRGELDPLYALKTHEDNPNLSQRDDDDGAKLNPKLAADQKALLETPDAGGYSGKALSVNKDTEHKGRWNTDLLNNVKDITGVEYSNKKIGDGGLTVDQAVDDIKANAEKKIPVPIVVGASESDFAHYVIVTATDPGPPRTFSIHDPANGTTETRTEDELKGGKIDIAGQAKGGGYMKLSAYEKPTPVAVK